MEKISYLFISGLLVIFSSLCSSAYAKYDEAPRISAATAYKMFKAGNAIFIDANPPESYARKHILGSINIPNDGPQDIDSVRNTEYPFSLDKKLVLYCL